MKKQIEVLLLTMIYFIMLAWVEWDYNPSLWHWGTRSIFVFLILMTMIVASYPGKTGGGK